MGKINKYANIYKNGELVRHVNDHGVLDNYTIEETEELLDKLANDKDEDGKVKDPTALNNVNAYLFSLYQKYGNPHEEEILEMIKNNKNNKTHEDEVNEKLKEVKEDLVSRKTDETTTVHNDTTEASGVDNRRTETSEPVMDKYVEYEEIPA